MNGCISIAIHLVGITRKKPMLSFSGSGGGGGGCSGFGVSHLFTEVLLQICKYRSDRQQGITVFILCFQAAAAVAAQVSECRIYLHRYCYKYWYPIAYQYIQRRFIYNGDTSAHAQRTEEIHVSIPCCRRRRRWRPRFRSVLSIYRYSYIYIYIQLRIYILIWT